MRNQLTLVSILCYRVGRFEIKIVLYSKHSDSCFINFESLEHKIKTTRY